MTDSSELLGSLTQLRVIFPDLRMGQLIANLVTAAGYEDPNAIWDIEDDELQSAAQRLIDRNCQRLEQSQNGQPMVSSAKPIGV